MRMLGCSALILSMNHNCVVGLFLIGLPINEVDVKANVMYSPTGRDPQIADAYQIAPLRCQRD